MKFTNTIIITVLLSLSNICLSQDDLRNVFEFSYDFGYSNISSPSNTYRTFTGMGPVLLSSKRGVITKNTNFSYTRFINQRNGLKVHIGSSEFGFDFEGTIINSNLQTKGSYLGRYLEFGVSYVHRLPISKFTKLLIAPGVQYNSDANSRTNLLNFFDKDSFSASSFIGLEIPMAANNFFINFGVQIKLALERYNQEFDENPPIYPRFIGFKVAANYQF